MTQPNAHPLSLSEIISLHQYEGIRDQDGWETLELTVRSNHITDVADAILAELSR
jgi:hypothetical protein